MAARLARDIPGAFKPDQYWNVENPAAHERTTGPELWDQTDGRITHFVASVGTGGTISGVAHVLKARNPAHPGHRRRSGRQRAVRGRGAAVPDRRGGGGLLPGHLRPCGRRSLGPRQRSRRLRDGPPDHARGGHPRRRIVRHRAGRRARGRPRACATTVGGDDAVVVVLLPDSGRNYLSKLYNDEWMRANGLLRDDRRGGPGRTTCSTTGTTPAAARPRPRPDDPARRRGDRRSSSDTASASCPCRKRPTGDALEGFVGSITEKGLLDRAFRDPSIVERTVGEVMDRPLPHVDVATSLDEAFALLSGGASAVIAIAGRTPGRRRDQARPARIPRPPARWPRLT